MSDTPTSQPAEPPSAPASVGKLEAAKGTASEPLRIYSHSAIIYWWPLWLLGLLFYILSITGLGDNEAAQRTMGLTYVFTLIFVIFSTTVRLRGANSVIFGLMVLIGFILLATSGLTGALGNFVASLDVHMSPMFYLVLGIGVFFEWVLMFFGFDRVKYWEIVPGQMHEKVVWGSGNRSENGANAKCHYRSDDFLRHRILGFLFRTGDLEIVLGDGSVWHLHNVARAKARARRVNELIVMRPID